MGTSKVSLPCLGSGFILYSWCAIRPTSTFSELWTLPEFLFKYLFFFVPKIYVPVCRTLQKSARGLLCDVYVSNKQLFPSDIFLTDCRESPDAVDLQLWARALTSCVAQQKLLWSSSQNCPLLPWSWLGISSEKQCSAADPSPISQYLDLKSTPGKKKKVSVTTLSFIYELK